VCFAKGVNSGYVPLGGVLMSPAIADTFGDRVYPGGLTYSGHPLACAVAVESIAVFEDEDILGQARRLGTDAAIPASAKSGVSVRSGPSSWCATGPRESRSCRSTRRAPMPRR
jgi:taurine--2-oxoglutarate transaminase